MRVEPCPPPAAIRGPRDELDRVRTHGGRRLHRDILLLSRVTCSCCRRSATWRREGVFSAKSAPNTPALLCGSRPHGDLDLDDHRKQDRHTVGPQPSRDRLRLLCEPVPCAGCGGLREDQLSVLVGCGRMADLSLVSSHCCLLETVRSRANDVLDDRCGVLLLAR